MLPPRIHRTNTILYCRHWMETVRFYRDTLQLPLAMEKDWFAEFRLGRDAFLSVADARYASVPAAAGAGITLSWQVTDIDAVYARMRAAGVAVTPFKRVWGARAFTFTDPEGHRIEIWS